jgi:uncharacterized repeat protein (TIGR01451 family)
MFKRDSVSAAIISETRRRYMRIAIRPAVLRNLLVLVSLVFGALAFLYFSRPVAAVNRTWDGGGVTNNWSEGANWSGDVAPDPLGSDFVIFDGTSSKNVTIDVPVIVSGYQINSPFGGEISQGSSSVTVNGASSQSSGTFTGGSGVIDFNSNFTLSGGAFTASSTTTSFAANFTQTGGTFTPNGGTVVFDGGGDSVVDVPTSLTLNNVTVNKTGGGRVLITGDPDTLVVVGTLTLTDGVVNVSGVTATLEAQGALSIASTFDGGNIILFISGAATRTVTLPAGVFLPRLTVNAPNVTVNTSGAGAITFTQAVNIQSVASFANGAVDFIFDVPFFQSGGTFTSGSGVIDFNSSFTLSSGTFTASSTTTSFATTFTPRGTFAPNGGTVVFDGGGDTVIDLGAASGVPASLTLNNVTVNKTGGRVVIQGDPDTLVVAGTLTLTDGQVVVNGVNATLEAQGALSIASTFDGGNIILLISGAATRTITLGAGALLPRLTVNAPNVTVNTSGAGAVTFTQPVNIQSVALFTNGTVDLTFNAGVTFTQSGGTFTGGSGAIDFNSSFTLSGGTFTASSTTTSFAATFTKTSGTFNPNGGTVVFDGSGESVLNFSPPLTLNNLTINKPNNVAVRIDPQVTLVVAGTLTLIDGVFDKNGALATTTLEAQGNVAIASTFDGGSVNFRFGGPTNQTYTNGGGLNVTSVWTVDKPAGAVALANNLILNNNQPLTITSGTLDQGASFNLQTSNTLTVGANGVLRNFGGGDLTLGGNVSNSGIININGGGTGCGDPNSTDQLQIRSTNTTVRTWSGNGTFSLVDVNVDTQAAGTPPGVITAFGSSVLGTNMGAGWTLNSGCPVEINSQPTNQTACLGGSASFSVGATGTGLSFQWRKGGTPLSNGGNISGAQSAILNINPVGTGDAGSYDVVVASSLGITSTSNQGTLSIANPPSITDGPDSAAVCEGQPVTFTAAASGTGPLTFQWRKGNNPILGATGSSFTINPVAPGDAGSYDVVVSGACSPPATSVPATLIVNSAPQISQQPTDQTACVAGSASFSVIATGTGLTFQWRRNGTPLSNGGNISGAGTPTLIINPVGVDDAATSVTGYDVVVSGTCSPAVTSTRQALAVNPPDLSIDKSHTGDFTVGTNGEYTLTATNVGTCTTGAITVTDTLPVGLSFVSGTGTNWGCSAAGQVVTCTNAGPLAPSGASTIMLTVGVSEAAVPTVTNTATVFTQDDSNAANNSDSDPTTVNVASCTPPPLNMVAWYPGDGNADDIQGNNDGTLQNGATFAPGMVAQAFSLDGNNDTVTAPQTTSLTSSFTLDAWINPDSLAGRNPVVLERGTSLTDRVGLQIFGDGGLCGYFDSTTCSVVAPSGTITTGTFTHVTFVLDDTANQVRLYVNGILVATATDNRSPSGSLGILTIGDSPTSGQNGEFFDGLVDEVEVFNRALAEVEIQSIVNAGSAGKCKPPPCSTIALSPSSLPGGTVGTPYSQTITPNGGTGPFTFTLDGSLPTGLNLNASTGEISGTPSTSSGSPFNFTLTATDANNCTGSRAYSITINPPACPTIIVNPESLPSGTVGQSYNQTISATAKSGTFTFAVTSGELPPGLKLNSLTGQLAGVPMTANGSPFNFTVTATDSAAGCSGSRAYSLAISCPAINISPASLPNGMVGAFYDQLISASGTTGPFTFAATGGALPPGINLNSTTGQLSGTPMASGLFNFAITATDASGSCSGSRTYSITIGGAPTPTPTPDIDPAGSTLVNESCPPANGVIDPGEHLTLSLTLTNNGGASTSNLVATLQTSANAIATSSPQTYGAIAPGNSASRVFSFTADGSPGSMLAVTLQLQDGAMNLGTATFTFALGSNTSCRISRLIVNSTLGRVNSTTVRAIYTVQNIGAVTANSVQLTAAQLGSTTGTLLPQSLGSLAPGVTSAPMEVFFTQSTPGASALLTLGGTYMGGTFSTTKRATVP